VVCPGTAKFGHATALTLVLKLLARGDTGEVICRIGVAGDPDEANDACVLCVPEPVQASGMLGALEASLVLHQRDQGLACR